MSYNGQQNKGSIQIKEYQSNSVETCDDCHGTGMNGETECSSCNGRGVI